MGNYKTSIGYIFLLFAMLLMVLGDFFLDAPARDFVAVLSLIAASICVVFISFED